MVGNKYDESEWEVGGIDGFFDGFRGICEWI
jgi:hypothetical protein